MAIYNKNQASVSQKGKKDFSRLSNEDDEVLSREHKNYQQHQFQESYLTIIGINRPPSCYLIKSSSFHLNLRKIALNSDFPQTLQFVHVINLSHKLSR